MAAMRKKRARGMCRNAAAVEPACAVAPGYRHRTTWQGQWNMCGRALARAFLGPAQNALLLRCIDID